MIQIIPSISIINGKLTRLKQGDYSRETVYQDSPVDIAKQFEDYGIQKIHIVDLDGARQGSPINYHILQMIAGYTDLKVDFSGGIRTDGDISKAYEHGATSVTASSVAINKRELFSSWLMSYGREKITLGADAKDGKITIRGWQTATNTDVEEHIDYFYMRGIKYVKCSDVNKDGIEEGPNFDLYKHLVKTFPNVHLLASGGVRSVDDIKKLEDIGVKGVIFGRAYYEGNLTLKDIESLLK
ncbi:MULTISPECIES: 1-(5-phosphoribosyl)-5-[(5-phosphoribosylamino)methylideneamino] imidazole-4-carboxamide isomerase [Roseivirga]|jgi:phosphoribosylformimino-5-aminoimidazole carboxamide ribotide isomerase|uniref:1-(5-phosphoribosyl)-5-[(5-phosphoribosylamino)methylideneamino] imidazole-4-carboxamide isomerase n=1 Tax=Roseivirga thermotolerans TaxID=1758176 RepID=A0ABQ3I7V6_9BACT|nr:MULTISPECIES: 1-(5-phosphoribosyl)-5-[(5-phosphoribosylamino)methylideneamino] imidazole-4-carboxamide isomerase [Roseivirga]MEC7754472.1 1-(5-phosphoribosyl)-5-[(5-phosphoribosylamino)methylideneamino] imidazole-4-carboxamide isomerase [Bacteroidota bacterium]GHE57833.1 1-(5-phosphoribosyl)-5-[(5-phosphoribosylamino) methylideneamino] imidazole-4-carboxamide isomerase [Roseivirga thermotolerans]|tara:strand:- start:6762 stop:7484 length:723 start_codon:yes stop_codon:yes gene_type:complete